MILTHITLATLTREPLVRDPARLLRLVRSLGHPQRLLFCVVDDHLHVVDVAERPAIRARGLARTAGAICARVPLAKPYAKPIQDRRHLLNLVGYVLDQPRKHELREHPALWPGSCFLDLIGARLTPGFSRGPLETELPRLHDTQLLRHVGLTLRDLTPLSDDATRRLGVAHLLDASFAVLGLPPPKSSSGGRASTSVVSARALAVQTARELGFAPKAIAQFLPVDPSTLWRLRSRALDPNLRRGLARRLAIEAAVQRRTQRALPR